MTEKIAIIGAGAASMAAISIILEKGGDCKIDVFEGRCDWGGRVKSLTVGKEPIDFGAEAIENESSKWKTLLVSGTENLAWKNLMENAVSGLYWASNTAQTSTEAIAAEKTFDLKDSAAIEIIKSRIESPKDGNAAADIQIIKSSTDLIKAFQNYTSSESIEPWIFSAKDKSRYVSESSETYPYLSTTNARLTLGDSFVKLGKKFESENPERLKVNWNKKVVAVGVSQSVANQGFSVLDQEKLTSSGYAAVLLTAPVPLLNEIQLPQSFNDIVKDQTEGIELGHYLKIAWPWKLAVDYCSDGKNDGFRVWFADPDGAFVWTLQAFPDSEILIASTTGAFAKQCSSNLDATAKSLEAQLQATFTGVGSPGEFVTHAWTTDSLASGCYSYCRAGFAKNREAFSKLSFPGLCFAGEAMSLGYYGQVDGAYDTGVAAGEQIVKYLGDL